VPVTCKKIRFLANFQFLLATYLNTKNARVRMLLLTDLSKKNGLSIFDQHIQEESEVITIPFTQSLASSPERKVAQILGPEVFEGISGGLDTLGEIYLIAHFETDCYSLTLHHVQVNIITVFQFQSKLIITHFKIYKLSVSATCYLIFFISFLF